MATEEELIAKLRSIFPPPPTGLGIGDDCALQIANGVTAITSDMLIENVDFTRNIPLRFIARKALTANLSDLASMGATPRSILLSVAIPPDEIQRAGEFFEAVAVAADDFNVSVIGGDLSRAASWFISITALGDLPSEQDALRRNGARSGDRIYVSRPIGASAAGLKLLTRGWSIDANGNVEPPETARKHGFTQLEFAASVIRFHVAPEPEISLGIRLREQKLATACIDVSDGLSTDLGRLCEASNVGGSIEWEKLPFFPDLHRTGFTLGIDSEKAALHGGEEYALLFTSPLRESDLSSRLGRPVYAIGRTTSERGLSMSREGETKELLAAGFDHFRSASS